MKKNIFVGLGFAACFVLGFVCGMFAQARIIAGNENEQASVAADYVVTNVGGIKCLDGSLPDAKGCCAGEEFTYLVDSDVWACCPESGDCFPPIPMPEQ